MTRAQQVEEKDAAAALPGTSMDDEAAARPWATDWYDDLLGQLTHSLHLHALDEMFGPPPTPRRGVPIRETDTRH